MGVKVLTATLVALVFPGASVSSAQAGSQPWMRYNLAPANRIVRPVSLYWATGDVGQPRAVLAGKATRLAPYSAVTLDFGKEVGGFARLHFPPSSPAGTVGLTYSESSTFVSTIRSDASNGISNNEPPVQYAVTPGGTVNTHTTAPIAGTDPAAQAKPETQLRGGFRYLTIVNLGEGPIELDNVSIEFTATPAMKNPRAYPNYFHSSDRLLNRIWYAGAYTVQLNIIGNDQGRLWLAPDVGSSNASPVGEAGTTVLVDGAKRDRTVWPGDLMIAGPTDYVSLNDMTSVRNAIQTLYNHQHPTTGELPYAGPLVNFGGSGDPVGSDTYHMWTLIGTAMYHDYTRDRAWLDAIWSQYRKGIEFVGTKVGEDGLFNVTNVYDWARNGAEGKNLEANAIAYRTLRTCVQLAKVKGDGVLAADCSAKAAALKRAVNAGGYWNAARGLYRDKPAPGQGSDLYPQDGNSLAVWFGLVDKPAKAEAISRALRARWTKVGAPTPEKGIFAVHPFPGSMELMAHLHAGRTGRALDLMRLEWGFMLNAPHGTASTFWEGYNRNGTFDYDGTYMSAAHGWSTGPTSALTFHVLGIAPDPSGGPGYRLAPHPGDLRYAQGKLTTRSGAIRLRWHVPAPKSRRAFTARYTAPVAAVEEFAVPTFGSVVQVRLDGKLVWDGRRGLRREARRTGGSITFDAPAGAHRVIVERAR